MFDVMLLGILFFEGWVVDEAVGELCSYFGCPFCDEFRLVPVFELHQVLFYCGVVFRQPVIPVAFG